MPTERVVHEAGTIHIKDRRYRLVRTDQRQEWSQSIVYDPPFGEGIPHLLKVEERSWHRGGFKSTPGFSATSEYGINSDARQPFVIKPSPKLNTINLGDGPVIKILTAKDYVWSLAGNKVFRTTLDGATTTLSKNFGAALVDAEVWGDDLYVTTNEYSGVLHRLVSIGSPDVWESQIPAWAFVKHHGSNASRVLNDAVVVQEGGANVTILSWSHAVGAGSNRILVVTASFDASGVSIAEVTYGSVPMTKLDDVANGTLRTELWYILNPPVGNATVQVTFSAAVSSAVCASRSYFGVDQSAPFNTWTAATGTGTAISVPGIPTAPGELVIDTVVKPGSNVLTAGPQQTEEYKEDNWAGGGSPVTYGAGSRKLPTSGTTSMSWTNPSSQPWAAGAVSMKPALAVDDDTISIQPASDVPAGAVLILRAGCRPKPGESVDVSSVTDSQGNMWTKLVEHSSHPWPTVALFACKLARGLVASSDTITVRFAGARSLRLVAVAEFVGPAFEVAGSNYSVQQSTTTPSVAITGLNAAQQHLLIGAVSVRHAGGYPTFTQDSDYANDSPAVQSQQPDYSRRYHLGTRVITAPGDTYNPVLSAASDTLSVIVALKPVANTYRLAAGVDRLFRVSKTGLLRNIAAGLDPLVEPNWADAVQIGRTSPPPLSLVAYAGTVLVGKTDGMYGVDDLGRARRMTSRIGESSLNTEGAMVIDPWVYVPYAGGLLRLSFGLVESVGLERELSNQSPVQGRISALASWGQWIFASLQANAGGTYILAGREQAPGENPFGPIVWDTFLYTPSYVYSLHVSYGSGAAESVATLWAGVGSTSLAYAVLGPAASQKFALSATRYTGRHNLDYLGDKLLTKLAVAGKGLSANVYYDIAVSVDGSSFVTVDRNNQNMRINADGYKVFDLPDGVQVPALKGREAQIRLTYTSNSDTAKGEINFLELYAIPYAPSTSVVSCLLLLAPEQAMDSGTEYASPSEQFAALKQLADTGEVVAIRAPWVSEYLGAGGATGARALVRKVSIRGVAQGPAGTLEMLAEVQLQIVRDK